MMSSKNATDLRSSKLFPHGSRLPPFPWSHCPSGLSKTIVDTGRFSASRSTSQGRWVRIGSIASSPGGSSSCFSDLELLVSDQENNSFNRKPNFGFTMGNSLQMPEAEGALKPCENDVASMCSSLSNLQFKEKEYNYIEKEKCKGRNILDAASSCSPYSPNNCTIGESNGFQLHLHTVDNSKQGNE